MLEGAIKRGGFNLNRIFYQQFNALKKYRIFFYFIFYSLYLILADLLIMASQWNLDLQLNSKLKLLKMEK